jgi:hypothetical protein
MVQLEMGSSAHCTMCPYKSPELRPELAMWLWEMHMGAQHHHQPPAAPPASTSHTTLTDSVKLPAVPSTTADDSYGLFTKSLPEEIRSKSSTKAATKPETRCSSGEDKPVTSDVTRWANNVAKKARQRAAKYGPKKLPLAKTIPEKQDILKKGPTDSMQLPAVPGIATKDICSLLNKSLPDGNKTKSFAGTESPPMRHKMFPHPNETSLKSFAAEAAFKSSSEAEGPPRRQP